MTTNEHWDRIAGLLDTIRINTRTVGSDYGMPQVAEMASQAMESLTALREQVRKLEDSLEQSQNECMEGHRAFESVFGESLRGREFAVKLTMARALVEAIHRDRDGALVERDQARTEVLRVLEPFAQYVTNAWPQPLPSELMSKHTYAAAALYARLSAALSPVDTP